MNRIFIIMAMPGEAKPLIKALGLKLHSTDHPLELYSDSKEKVWLSMNGIDPQHGVDLIGTQAATLNAYAICTKHSPSLVINAGTAGGIKAAGLQIGDVVLSREKFYYHDRRIALPRFEEFGYGSIPGLDTTMLAEKLGLRREYFTTGDSLDHTDSDLAIINRNMSTVKDMESAAVAWVCSLFNIPYFAVRSITDFVAADNHLEFEQNFRHAVEALTTQMVRIIDLLRDSDSLNQ